MNCIKKICKGKCPCPDGCDWQNFDSTFCDYYEDPFCGSDNVTYQSNCEFNTAKCESLGLYGVELTGYSLSEALILASINLKIWQQIVYWITSSAHDLYKTCIELEVF